MHMVILLSFFLYPLPPVDVHVCVSICNTVNYSDGFLVIIFPNKMAGSLVKLVELSEGALTVLVVFFCV